MAARHVFAAAFAAVVLVLTACSRAGDFDRMRLQHRADPFGASSAFADGAAMRVPPEGTVTFGTSDQQPATTAGRIDAGHRAFDAICAVCHGADASGQSVMAANMPLVPPPALKTARVRQMTDADLFAIVTHGRNRMPAFDWALSADERWEIVAYLRSVQAP